MKFFKIYKKFFLNIRPIQVFLIGFCILVSLTFVTINMYILKYNSIYFALLIASTKALIVLLIFMGLWKDNKMHLLNILLALFFIVLLIFFCMLDENTRTYISWEKENFLPQKEELFYKKFPMYSNDNINKNE